MTLKELRDFIDARIKALEANPPPETLCDDDQVWVSTEPGLSNPVTSVTTLAYDGIILFTRKGEG